MNKLLKKISAIAIVFAMTVNVFAETANNASTWAKNSFDKAIDLGIVADSLYQRANTNITRKEICNLSIDLLRVFTGKSGLTLAPSPFHDDKSNEVAFAYETGILSGVTNTLFAPDGFVTREQLAVIVANTLEACGVQLDMGVKSWTVFKDEDQIDSDALEAINLLEYEKVVSGYDGMYYPKTYVTVEQAVSVFLKTYEAFKTYDLAIGGKDIKFGEPKESIVNKLGEPDKITINEFGFERYTYKKDLTNFVIVGFKDDKVAEMFSNAKNMQYKSINHDTRISDINDIGIIYSGGSDNVNIRSHETMTTVYFDSSEDLKVDAVYIRGTNLTTDPTKFTLEFAKNTETELFDIINAARVRRGLTPFIWSEKASASAKTHSADMRLKDYTEYNNESGQTPFERMDSEGIKFKLAAENISWIMGDAISIYTSWISGAGTRTNIFNKTFTHAGIGSVASGSSACTTIDIFTP